MMRYVPFIIISLILYALFFYHSQQTVIVYSKDFVQEEINTNNKIISLDLNNTTEQQITSQNIAIDDKGSENTPSSSAPSEALATNQAIDDTRTSVIQPSFEKSKKITISEANTNQPIPEVAKLSEENPETIKLTVEKPEAKINEPETVTQAHIFEMPQAISETPVTAIEQPIVEEQTKAQNVVSLDTKKVTEQYSIEMTEAHQSALLKGEFYDKTFHLHLSDPVVKSSPTKEIANKKASLKTTSVSASNSLLKLTQQIPDNQLEIENDKPKRTFKKVVKPFSNNNGLSEAIVASGNKPSYPKQAAKEKLQGTVTVKFIVSIEGESQSPKMVSSSGHKILDTTVLDFVKKERFMPSFNGVEKITKEQQFTHKFVTQE